MLSSKNIFISIIIMFLTLFGITDVNGNEKPAPDYRLHNINIIPDGSAGYKAVELNSYIYRENCNLEPYSYSDYYEYNNLKTLRVIDDNGEYVPYFLESGVGNNNLSILRKSDNSVTYKITNTDKSNSNYVPNKMVFDGKNGGKDYLANVEVYGSNNDADYELITEDTIYFTDGKLKNFIELPNCKNYFYFKVVYEQNGVKPDFTSAYIQYGYNKSEELTNLKTLQEGTFDYNMQYEITQLEDTNETEISISNVYGVYIDNIKIIADGVFIRDVMFDGNTYEIYNYTVDGIPITNTKLYLDSEEFCTDNDKKIIIKNNDDKPIDIQGIVITYKCDRVVFESNGVDNYYLQIGNKNLEKPVYDIQKLSKQIIEQGYDVLELGEIDITYEYDTYESDIEGIENVEETEDNNNFIFSLESDIDWLNVIVVGVALVLIGIVIKTIEDK